MAGIAAKNAAVYANGYNLSPFLQSVTHAGTADAEESQTFGDSAKERTVTLSDASISVEGLWGANPAASPPTDVDDALHAALGSTDDVWVHVPQQDAIGNRCKGFIGHTTSYEVGDEVDGLVTVSAEVESSSGMEHGQVVHARGAETVTGNGAAVNGGAATTAGGSAILEAFSQAGTAETADVIVEDSADGSSGWATIATFAQLNEGAGVTPRAQRVAIAGTIRQFVRASWTIGGSGGPTFTFFVAVFRK